MGDPSARVFEVFLIVSQSVTLNRSIAQESTASIKTFIDQDETGGKAIRDIFTSSIPVTYGALDNLAQIQNQQLIGRYPNYRDHFFESIAIQKIE